MKTEKKLFPLYTDLTQKKAVVIGGGKIAARRITSLLGFVGELVVIAPLVPVSYTHLDVYKRQGRRYRHPAGF